MTKEQKYLAYAQASLEKAQQFMAHTWYANASHSAGVAQVQAAVAAKDPALQAAAQELTAKAEALQNDAREAARAEALQAAA